MAKRIQIRLSVVLDAKTEFVVTHEIDGAALAKLITPPGEHLAQAIAKLGALLVADMEKPAWARETFA